MKYARIGSVFLCISPTQHRQHAQRGYRPAIRNTLSQRESHTVMS
ncbi:hypothetical protein D083_4088 [Dickeya solani RNS 08.23.3.1.A]|nr:hypothetical protein D083_4088 [Dickeya solani RNS 08.23.3.1.A]